MVMEKKRSRSGAESDHHRLEECRSDEVIRYGKFKQMECYYNTPSSDHYNINCYNVVAIPPLIIILKIASLL